MLHGSPFFKLSLAVNSFLCCMHWKVVLGFAFMALIIGCQEGERSASLSPVSGDNEVNFARHFGIYPTATGHQLVIAYDEQHYIVEVDTTRSGDPVLISHSKVVMPAASKVACLSTTHASLLDKAGAVNTIQGVGFADLIRNENTRALIDAGSVTDLGGEDDVDFELLVDLNPDCFLVYPFGGTDYGRFQEAGVPCIPICEYREIHPLGRAEWIKAMGLLTGRYEEANRAFQQIRENYFRTKADWLMHMGELNPELDDAAIDSLVNQADAKNLPTVFTGSFAQGIWYAPPGNSFIGEFVTDAGARYIYRDIQQDGNIEIQFEELFDTAYDVDWWGKVIFEEGDLTTAMIRADDERFTELKAFREKQVFYCNAAETDYFGDGVVEPHVILRDLMHIFYPDFSSGYQPVYFKKIEE